MQFCPFSPSFALEGHLVHRHSLLSLSSGSLPTGGEIWSVALCGHVAVTGCSTLSPFPFLDLVCPSATALYVSLARVPSLPGLSVFLFAVFHPPSLRLSWSLRPHCRSKSCSFLRLLSGPPSRLPVSSHSTFSYAPHLAPSTM